MPNKINDTDFSKILPNVLQNDESILAIAKATTSKLLDISNLLENVQIYTNIDNLPEGIVDILAYDMHVDWYDETYPLDVKREVVKSSVIVHKKMGTKYAVEKALRAVHPDSSIEEWFEYNGNPFCFRIICDTTKSKIEASYEDIVNTVKMYKRLSAHPESVTYQSHATILITTETNWYIYKTPLTGKIKAGTYPQRNVKGRDIQGKYAINTNGKNYKYISRQAGTYPQRNINFKNREEKTRVQTELQKTKFETPLTGKTAAGTKPGRNEIGRDREKEMAAKTSAEKYGYNTKMCGSNKKL